jgi:non-ribosomal peptide synthetase component F
MQRLLLQQAFEACAEQFPGKIAVSEKNRDISYLLLNREANYLASLLQNMGAGTNEPVAFLGTGSIDMAVAVLGIFKAGSIYMPADITLPDDTLKNIIRQSGCRYLITTRSYRQLVIKWCREEELPLECLITLTPDYLETGVIRKENNEWCAEKQPQIKNIVNPDNHTGPYHPCYQFYLPGTGDELHILQGYHKELEQLVNWEIDVLQIGTNIRSGSLSAISEESSLRDMLVPLTTGGTVCITSEETRNHPGYVIEWIRNAGVQLLHLSTPVFYSLYKEAAKKIMGNGDCIFPGLRHVLLSGNPLPQKIMHAWEQLIGEETEIIHLYETPVAGTVSL